LRQDAESLARHAKRQAEALTVCAASGEVAEHLLLSRGITRATLDRLNTLGWLEPLERAITSPIIGPGNGNGNGNGNGQAAPHGPEVPPELTSDQHDVLDRIRRSGEGYATWLLHGVTGSGKTEVYLRLMESRLQTGLQTLMLVPEIGLTPQLVARLRGRFGDSLAVMHSGLNEKQRFEAWVRVRSGEAAIAVGTRSAVFAPLSRPGLIVVDEEHDPSYKQQQGFRYSARDLAVLRASRLKIPVLLASATPSLESWHHARSGRYRKLEMPNRVGSAGKPHLKVLDMNRHAARQGLSTPLITAMQKHLGEGHQILLFLNRRGFAPVLFCPQCRSTEQCPRCDANLTIHARAGRLRCHHCGTEKSLSWACVQCGNERLAVGAGTQRVAEEIEALFPDARIARLDRDVTARRGALDAVLDDVHRGRTNILIGTQMLTKGHDFPNVTLVGVLNADQGLFGTDFRSDERLAQTILQVAGRAGRAEFNGEVLIQTHYPDHPLLISLLQQDYDTFAELALAERREAGWPPFAHLALWRAEAARRESAFAFLDRLKRTLEHYAGRRVQVMGPAPATIERRNNRYRAQLMCHSRSRAPLHELMKTSIEEVRQWNDSRRVRWSLDMDPLDL
jgi:primosomal protein N' (replication factor Y) (superfamily II helicase)